jgi:hypothetical protein
MRKKKERGEGRKEREGRGERERRGMTEPPLGNPGEEEEEEEEEEESKERKETEEESESGGGEILIKEIKGRKGEEDSESETEREEWTDLCKGIHLPVAASWLDPWNTLTYSNDTLELGGRILKYVDRWKATCGGESMIRN